jgi:hypothetical protein
MVEVHVDSDQSKFLKSILLLALFVAGVVLTSRAADRSLVVTSDRVKPYLFSTNHSRGVVFHKPAGDFPHFKDYTNLTLIESGVKFAVHQKVTLNPYLKFYDLEWSVNNAGTMQFTRIHVMTGLSGTFGVNESLSVTSWFGGEAKMESASGIWIGFNTGIGTTIKNEKRWLTLKLKGSFIPLFETGLSQKKSISLRSVYEYFWSFLFFNYIDKRTGTGLYIAGKADIEPIILNGSASQVSAWNILFAGITASPVSFFSCYCSAALYLYGDGTDQNGTWYGNGKLFAGMKTGLTWKVKWFTFECYWNPWFLTVKNGIQGNMIHTIGLVCVIKVN